MRLDKQPLRNTRQTGVVEQPPAETPPEPGQPQFTMDRRQAICAGILLLQGVYRLALLFTTSWLIGTHPLLLEALRGSTSSLIAGGAFAETGRASQSGTTANWQRRSHCGLRPSPLRPS